MKRFGQIIGMKSERLDEYKKCHAEFPIHVLKGQRRYLSRCPVHQMIVASDIPQLLSGDSRKRTSIQLATTHYDSTSCNILELTH